jgi:hypothetical protein
MSGLDDFTDTYGGRQAVGELKDACTTVRQVRPGALPVVQLATGSMPTRYGPRPRPDFQVIDWRGSTSAAPATIQQQIEQQTVDANAGGAPFGNDLNDQIPW